MSDRLVTALGALAALVLLGALTFQGPGPAPVTRPTSVEAGPNGHAALAQWLEAEGVPVRSQRTRMDALERWDLPAAGNLLITAMPHRSRFRSWEFGTLLGWVMDGNTVVVLAALNDTPSWALDVDSGYFLSDLEVLSGMALAEPEQEELRRQTGSLTGITTVTLEGLTAHPLMSGVSTLQGESDSLAAIWEARPRGGTSSALVQLARDAQSGAGAVWQLRAGRGHVLVSSLGSLLTNRAIGEADNARLAANLLAHHLGPGGAVIFDDMHQGLSTLYDPEAFFSDPRLGATVAFVLGFWALYLLGSSNRLGPPVPGRVVPSQGSFVAAVGGFLARKLTRAEAGRMMVGAWLDELERRGVLPPGAPPWQALAAFPTVRSGALARLRHYHDAMERAEDVDLRAVHNTIEELRRMLR